MKHSSPSCFTPALTAIKCAFVIHYLLAFISIPLKKTHGFAIMKLLPKEALKDSLISTKYHAIILEAFYEIAQIYKYFAAVEMDHYTTLNKVLL